MHVDAKRIHRKVPRAVLLSLLCVEVDHIAASLVMSQTSSKFVEGDLPIRQPGVREDSVVAKDS